MSTDRIAQLTSRVKYGVTPAMATPLLADGRTVNLAAVGSLVDFLVGAGVKGLFVGGTTGEGILLELDQRQRLHERAMQAIDGRVPALIHVGANSTVEGVALAHHAQSLEADAIVAVTPPFYTMHDAALAAYYSELAAAAPDVPLLAYEIPHMAVNRVSPSLLRKLASDIPSFAGIKSSNQDAQVIRSLIDAAPAGIFLLAGNERIALGSLSLGATGLISGLSTVIPEPFVRLTDAFFGGDIAEALIQQKRINAMLDLIPPGARIGAIKSLLHQRGIDAGPPVPPRPALAAEEWPAWPKFAQLIG